MLYPFFELSSVASAYKGNFLSNPASLGYSSKELSFIYYDTSYIGILSLWNLGFYGGKFGKETFYGIGGGLNVRDIFLGSTYDIRSKSYGIGILWRGYRFLSLGFTVALSKDSMKYSAGIGIRLLKEYITLYADALDITKNNFEWKAGAYIQPFPYIGIRGEITGDKTIYAGLEVAYSKLKLGVSSDINKPERPSFGVMITDKSITPKLSFREYHYSKKVSSYTEDGRVGFFGEGEKFYDFIKALKDASENPRVKTIFLDLTNYALSSAQADEVLEILKEAKKKGKRIIFYSEGYSLRSYYLASVGEIYMAPEGDFELLGPYAEVEFLKGTLDKLGIKVQVFRVGKYKSAVEPLIQDTLSEANREQIKRLLTTTWDIWLNEVSKNRNIPIDSLEKIIREYGYLSGEEALKFGLVDSLLYYDQVKDMLKGREYKGSMKVDTRPWKDEKPKIALVIAEGEIVDGESSFSPIPVLGGKTVGSATIRKIFEEIRKDKSIKGVVLRVNSPGGSGLASDIMAREIKLTDKEKPVVVSMGAVAASGGYFISAPARKIFVDRRTITGSIGVFGLKVVLGGFYSKIGMKREVVKLYPHSDAFSPWREMDSTELRRAQELVDYFYWRFVNHVADGRKLPKDSVHSIAQGRVWSGVDAVSIGLSDEFGGILDAIEYVKKEAKIKGDYEVVVYPKPKSILDRIKDMTKLSSFEFSGVKVMYRLEYDIETNF